MKRAPRLLLALLLLLIAAAAAWVPWHGTMSVDDRTVFEMIDDVAARGAPYHTGDAQARYPEMRPRWNLLHDGKTWGNYPPLYAYLMAPPYLAGGVRAVIRANILALCLLALALFAVSRALTGSDWAAVATAWLVIVSIPVWAGTFVPSSFTLAITAITWSVYFALRSAAAPEARKWPFLVGAVGALAVGLHLLAFPMLAALWVTLSLLPNRSWKRSLWLLAGAAIPLMVMSIFNQVRFGLFSPLTYGPCVWRQCDDSGQHGQTAAASLGYALPILVWAAGAAIAAVWVRRSKLALALTGAVALGVLLSTPSLRSPAIAYATLGWALLIDTSRLSLGGDFFTPPDGLGVFLGPWAVKSVIQCTPLLGLALLYRTDGKNRARAALVAVPCAALFAAVVLRANIPLAFALGYPFLHYRYAMFGLPLLGVLAVAAARDLPWRKIDLALAALFAAAAALVFLRTPDDFALPKRLLLLRGSLLLAFGAFVLFARFRSDGGARFGRAAALSAALAGGFGFAATLSVDLRALCEVRNANDARYERLLAATPARFALIGWPREIDPVLAAQGTRSIEYADLYELRDWTTVRPLLDEWSRRGLPIFFLLPQNPPPSPWPDVRWQPVDPSIGLVRLAGTSAVGGEKKPLAQ